MTISRRTTMLGWQSNGPWHWRPAVKPGEIYPSTLFETRSGTPNPVTWKRSLRLHLLSAEMSGDEQNKLVGG
jgi:hypothetical protein